MELDRKRKREYREILGIDENADEEMLKKAYRRLAMEYHPDRPNNKGKKEEAEQMFKKVTEAYEALQNSGATISILKNSFKSSEIHSSLEQFLFSTGKINTFTNPTASGDASGSNIPGTTSNASFNLGNLNGSSASALFSNLSAKFNIHNNNHSSHNNGHHHHHSTSSSNNNNNHASSTTTNSNGSLNLAAAAAAAFHNSSSNIANMHNSSSSTSTSPTTSTTTHVGGGRTPRRGQSLQTTLKVGFEEGLYGCTKTIEFSRSLACGACQGHGAALSKLHSSTSSFISNCRDCGGKGVLIAKIAGAGVSTPCVTCSGSSASRDSLRGLLCQECKGSGKMPSKKTCTVSVPPGVATGMQQVFEGEGDEGTDGGQPGDLIICFEVEPHPFYQRHGDDVYCKVPLPFPHAALGTKLEVPSIYGEPVTVDVAPGTQHKHVIKVTEEGFFNTNDGKRGNMYLQVCIELPKALSDAEKKLLKKLASKDNFKSKFKTDLDKNVPPPF